MLTIYLVSSLSLGAQEISFPDAEQYAEKLVKKEILTSHGRDVLLRELKGKRLETDFRSDVIGTTHAYYGPRKENILQFCALAFGDEMMDRALHHREIEEEIKAEDSLVKSQIAFFGGPRRDGYTNCISRKRSTLGKTITRTLQDIKDIGLISDQVYQECRQGLKSGSIFYEPGLFETMAERTTYYDHYDLGKKEQVEYVEGLVRVGIMTAEQQSALLRSYQPFELKTIPEILSFCSHYLPLDFSQVEATPDKIYPVIFDSVKRLLPDFHYFNLKLEIIESKEEDLIRQDLKISFTVDSGSYSHVLFYNYRHVVPDTSGRDKPERVNDEFSKVVNKWLTNIGSEYRLFTVDLNGKNGVIRGRDKVGLLLLTEAQAEVMTKMISDLSGP